MKKIIFTLALVCAMMTACSNSKTVETTDSVVKDTVEIVDSTSVDTISESYTVL